MIVHIFHWASIESFKSGTEATPVVFSRGRKLLSRLVECSLISTILRCVSRSEYVKLMDPEASKEISNIERGARMALKWFPRQSTLVNPSHSQVWGHMSCSDLLDFIGPREMGDSLREDRGFVEKEVVRQFRLLRSPWP